MSDMPLLDQIQKDMVTAMKAKDEARLSTVRMVKSALQKFQVDTMKPLDEASEMQVLNTLLKQRRDSVEMFRNGGREELAAKEEAELRVIESYLPAAPSAEELEAAITAAMTETGITEKAKMGQVMNAAKAKLAGKRVDGKVLSDLIRARLT
ncbi:MAG: GatB/YqeY domain-containing protein [Acidobacteria bacterium]|nr:GatB/YqeY domain-containing protein [Acidobacteriota bacterium]